MWPFGPETLPDESNTRNLSPLFTDGRFLFILSQMKAETFRFFVDLYDPTQRMTHVKRVELSFPIGSKNKKKKKSHISPF